MDAADTSAGCTALCWCFCGCCLQSSVGLRTGIGWSEGRPAPCFISPSLVGATKWHASHFLTALEEDCPAYFSSCSRHEIYSREGQFMQTKRRVTSCCYLLWPLIRSMTIAICHGGWATSCRDSALPIPCVCRSDPQRGIALHRGNHRARINSRNVSVSTALAIGPISERCLTQRLFDCLVLRICEAASKS